MNSEQLEFKRQQRAALLRAKEAKAVSIASHDRSKLIEEVPPEQDGEWKPTKCFVCHGTGKVGGLFSSYDCAMCESTGFCLDEPVKLVLYLLAAGRKVKATCINMKREHKAFRDMWTETEIQQRIDHKMGEEINSRFD